MSHYSAVLMDHFSSPRNVGQMDLPDAAGVVGAPGCGPYMELCLRLDGGRVMDAKFQTFGCGPAIAAGSLLTTLIIGRSVAECLELTPEQLVEALGGLPPEKLFCAGLAIDALRDGLVAGQGEDALGRAGG